MQVDLVLIATRRSKLLMQTLKSFSQHVFLHYEINNVIINIDPIWGNENDHEAVKDIVKSYFKNITFIEPETPNFCSAVRNTWLKTTAETVLHLEEDWIALEAIPSLRVLENLSVETPSLALMNENKNWNGKQVYHYRRHRPWYLPFKVEDKSRPYFSTSPSFWKGDFLRECAELLDAEYDPEKQFYSDVNFALQDHVKEKKCKFLIGSPYLVKDIGREWQKQMGVVKTIVNGTSAWS